jgi:hypothetical protein
MKKYLILAIFLTSIVLVPCATEQKPVQPIYTPREEYDAPLWNVGDSWKFQDEDGRSWSHKVVKVENNLYSVENPEDRCGYIYEMKTLQLKIGTDYGTKKTISSPGSDIFYDFPLYVGKKWTKMGLRSLWRMPAMHYLHEFKVISV